MTGVGHSLVQWLVVRNRYPTEPCVNLHVNLKQNRGQDSIRGEKDFLKKAQKQQQNDLILIIGNCAMRIAINADANYAGENA